MLSKMFTRQARLDDADPAQRLLALAELPPDADDLARLLTADPAPGGNASCRNRWSRFWLLSHFPCLGDP